MKTFLSLLSGNGTLLSWNKGVTAIEEPSLLNRENERSDNSVILLALACLKVQQKQIIGDHSAPPGKW